ncbi:uncharacterized protein BP5553_02069 [Venustampulla echinocandica]|uniref:Uncharacterized protein n=1 Tax=Venustampulla echinocandica TaxID=2656787 RepID=A0A370U2T2_9HELO|nr:uncharacterized protein BP5553_02069 [Venustampulla echinocandica]RDL42090.1 hypothetical protein BP5553_02069 [Venustampulla echinocandica]
MATLSTLSGWAVIVLVIGGYWYFYTNRPNRNRRVQAFKPPLKSIDPRSEKEPKGKKARKDSTLSNSDQAEKKKSQQPPKANREEQSHASSRATGVADREDKDEMDNREFARQLSNIKAGTVIANKSQTAAPKQKSVKQSKAQEKPPVEASSDNATAPSSATGGDADDDESPLNSPELGATRMASSVTNGGISDMLEKPAAGPSILKITEPLNPSRPNKPKPQSFEAVESKKQRQNRKKTEAKKQAREEDEKERKVLMEKQRRTAREAEGRAAKDGSTFMAAKPASSVWTPGAAKKNDKPGKSNVELLDTYEPSKARKSGAATIPAEALYSEGELVGSDWQNHFSSLPSEEEQTRIAMEESDNWKTVKAKERRKRENKPKSSEDRQSSADEQNEYAAPPVIAPTAPGKKWAATLVHVEINGDAAEQEKDLQDSEWEVA